MKIKKTLFVVIALAVFGILAVTWSSRGPSKQYTGPLEKIRLSAAVHPESSALIYVADERGFFRDHGLDVSIKDYEAGVLAMEDLVADEIDAATISEFVLVNQIFAGLDIKALCTTVRGTFLDFTGRKDRGIKKGTDLKGKKIGSVRGTSMDFFLEGYLNSQGIRIKDVQIVYLRPSEMVDAVLNGAIDGAVSFNPHSDKMEKSLRPNAVSWSVQRHQDSYKLLVAKPSFIKAHPFAVERLLKAMIDAEQYIETNEAGARRIVAERSKTDPSILPSVWQMSRFSVRLDQDILSLMEDEARWILRNKLTDKTRVPNYFDSIYLDGLEKVKPEAVTIIH
jgi:NitT/TauT family transport system substrate-binding protein